LFSGDGSETELFCQLCGDIFKIYPCKFWPEDSKLTLYNKEAARSWYKTKYSNGLPAS